MGATGGRTGSVMAPPYPSAARITQVLAGVEGLLMMLLGPDPAAAVNARRRFGRADLDYRRRGLHRVAPGGRAPRARAPRPRAGQPRRAGARAGRAADVSRSGRGARRRR